MIHSRWRFPCLMMSLLAPAGACTLETEVPGTAGDLEAEVDPPAPGQELETLAEVTIPTKDGQASYRFRFDRIDDGPVLTIIESPLGYPAPDVPTECALDTFLRVAPADSLVPAALIEHCLTPAERVERGLPEAGEVSVRAADLQDPTQILALDYQAAAQGAACTTQAFAQRVNELEVLAAYVPTVPVCQPGECEFAVAWDLENCQFMDGNGNFDSYCSPAYHASLLYEAVSGYKCLQYSPPSCVAVPDPFCSHTWFVLGDWGPFGVWQRTSNGFSETTNVRAEVSVCSVQEPATGWWRMKREAADPFGAQHPLTFAPGALTTIILTAGAQNDLWRGMDFQIHAEGDNMHVISAWVYMQGLIYSRCPVAI
ncbi:MAG TPA: hypothetical protein VNM90_28180 [Haliangium sp.]|nr:hypothetical protein [Haliangium sp.]